MKVYTKLSSLHCTHCSKIGPKIREKSQNNTSFLSGKSRRTVAKMASKFREGRAFDFLIGFWYRTAKSVGILTKQDAFILSIWNMGNGSGSRHFLAGWKEISSEKHSDCVSQQYLPVLVCYVCLAYIRLLFEGMKTGLIILPSPLNRCFQLFGKKLPF